MLAIRPCLKYVTGLLNLSYREYAIGRMKSKYLDWVLDPAVILRQQTVSQFPAEAPTPRPRNKFPARQML